MTVNLGSNNLILKFLCTLIEEKPSVLSSEMASSIGRVLGEVGPRDMECIALPSARNQSKVKVVVTFT